MRKDLFPFQSECWTLPNSDYQFLMVSVSWLCFLLPFCITKCPRHKESPSQSNVYKQEGPGKKISVEYNLFSNSKNPFNGYPCQGLWNVHQSNLNQLCEMFQDIQDGISEVLILILQLWHGISKYRWTAAGMGPFTDWMGASTSVSRRILGNI